MVVNIVPNVGTESFLENPIDVVAADMDSVTFTVTQSIKESGTSIVSIFATFYTPYSYDGTGPKESSPICDK
jgi:hypothetical protein